VNAARPRLPAGIAGLLTFVATATVLVLEIAAGRLLAPYVGVSLQTYTGIIGVILAGIALGAWAGGRASDEHPPERLLGPTFIAGGVAAAAAVPVVTAVGALGLGTSLAAIVILSALGFFIPAAILSAVAPMIVRASITDVETSGSLVGRLSAIGTVGAITGTFLTGFLLLGLFPTRVLILAAAGLMVLLGVALTLSLRPARPARPAGGTGRDSPAGTSLLGLGAFLLTGATGLALPNVCERESRYYCISVVGDPVRPDGVTLVLDGLRHAYVDRSDPRHLEFRYIRWFADATAPTIEASGGNVDVLHLGGGGFSFPRYLADTHERSRHTVLELDPEVLDVARAELAFAPHPRIHVRVGDARLSIRDLPTDRYDVAVGDAFGGLSVPWHLTTREMLREVDRTLRPDGMYVMNVIDSAPFGFARAETATLRTLFPHVAVIGAPGTFEDSGGGNIILVGSHQPVDPADLLRRIEARGAGDATLTRVVVDAAALAAWIGDAPLLTEDYAPVDQLLTR
jgi:spermidine synthase